MIFIIRLTNEEIIKRLHLLQGIYDRNGKITTKNCTAEETKAVRWLRQLAKNKCSIPNKKLFDKHSPSITQLIFREQKEKAWSFEMNVEAYKQFMSDYGRLPRNRVGSTVHEVRLYSWFRAVRQAYRRGNLSDYKIQLIENIDSRLLAEDTIFRCFATEYEKANTKPEVEEVREPIYIENFLKVYPIKLSEMRKTTREKVYRLASYNGDDALWNKGVKLDNLLKLAGAGVRCLRELYTKEKAFYLYTREMLGDELWVKLHRKYDSTIIFDTEIDHIYRVLGLTSFGTLARVYGLNSLEGITRRLRLMTGFLTNRNSYGVISIVRQVYSYSVAYMNSYYDREESRYTAFHSTYTDMCRAVHEQKLEPTYRKVYLFITGYEETDKHIRAIRTKDATYKVKALSLSQDCLESADNNVINILKENITRESAEELYKISMNLLNSY